MQKRVTLHQNSSVVSSYILDIISLKMASRQAGNKRFQRVCEICSRSNQNERLLGPLINSQTISAHYNCVMFSPVTVDATSKEDHGICGVTARFIRTEGSRAKKLVWSIFRFYLSEF